MLLFSWTLVHRMLSIKTIWQIKVKKTTSKRQKVWQRVSFRKTCLIFRKGNITYFYIFLFLYSFIFFLSLDVDAAENTHHDKDKKQFVVEDEIFDKDKMQKWMEVQTEEDKNLLEPTVWKTKNKLQADKEKCRLELLEKKVRSQ